MFLYPYTCPAGHREDQRRQVAERDAERPCPTCGGPLRRVFGEQVHAQQFLWHQSLWTQWYDVHAESPRELYRRKDLVPYDPTLPDRPDPAPANIRRYLPKSLAEMEGSSQRLLAPLPQEGDYAIV